MQTTSQYALGKAKDGHMQQVESFLRKLAPREEQILRLRFGIGTEPHHAEDVGRGLGISAAMVTRIQCRALYRLRMLALDDA